MVSRTQAQSKNVCINYRAEGRTLQCKHPRRDAQRGRVQLAIARLGFLTLEALRTQIENDFVIV